MGEFADTMAKGNLLVFPNSIFMIMIHWVSKGKDIVLSTKQLQPSYIKMRHRE